MMSVPPNLLISCFSRLGLDFGIHRVDERLDISVAVRERLKLAEDHLDGSACGRRRLNAVIGKRKHQQPPPFLWPDWPDGTPGLNAAALMTIGRSAVPLAVR